MAGWLCMRVLNKSGMLVLSGADLQANLYTLNNTPVYCSLDCVCD